MQDLTLVMCCKPLASKLRRITAETKKGSEEPFGDAARVTLYQGAAYDSAQISCPILQSAECARG